MTPFRYAMCFVDGYSCELVLLVYGSQMLSEVVQHAELRGDIEQPDTGMTRAEIIQDRRFDSWRCLAVDCSDVYARSTKSSDLIIHQSQQRRDDNGNTNVHDRGQLEAQTFAEACGSLKKDIMTV